MLIRDVQKGGNALTVQWLDGSKTDYPFLWLRDNDAGAFHSDTLERTLDLLTIDDAIKPDSVEIDSGGGTVRHMVYEPSTREIWFGTDTNTVGRAKIPVPLSDR